MQWYRLPAGEALDRLGATARGLSGEEARERLARFGPNRLAEEERISRLAIALHQFTSPLIYILLIAAAVTFFLHEHIDMGVILAVVVLNAVIGYAQEYKAEESVRALKKLAVPKARVLRDGRDREVNSEDLVPGDVVLLASGVKVPADLRLISALELRADESALTGESVPAEKFTEPIREENLTPGDQRNMAFMGTVIVSGRGRGAVVETGSRTVLGSIAREVKEIGVVKAPLQHKIERFAKVIGLIVLAACAAISFIGVLMGESLRDMFTTAVAAAVATIPEGLPIVVTIAMAIGVSRMAGRNAIVRKLAAVETLGSTTVIGSDKTGTLSKNEMTVRLLFDGRETFEVTGIGYRPEGQFLRDQMPVRASELKRLVDVLRIGLLCNESAVYEEDGEFKVDGDPTEGALIVSAMKAGLSPDLERKRYEQVALIPFESEFGYMAALFHHRGKKLLFVKGAPEKVIEMCSGVGEAERREIMAVASNFAREGLRVLAMALKEMPPETGTVGRADAAGLAFCGLQGMIDPPRPEAIEAVDGCRRAGIRVVMITGDHAVTAQAIARKLGIGGDRPGVLTGREMEGMSDDELFEKVREFSVFARVSPQHKLRIVQQFMRRGEVVAVTGDGVNDAPALKAAHIGVAMGRTGTDVAKEAADIIVADDNFRSIFDAVEQGRIVFDNIRKVTFFLIPTGIAAILSIAGTMAMGLPIPYVPAQLLWINLVTNGLQDVALAFEPGERGIIDRPPRPPGEGIMSRLLIERTVLVSVLISAGVIYTFVDSLQRTGSLDHARTVAVTTMVFFQFFQAWNSRSEQRSVFRMRLLGNPFLFFSMVAAFFAQLAVLYVPPLQFVFRTVPLTGGEWAEISMVALTVVVAVEIDKGIRRRTARPRPGAAQPQGGGGRG
ncbi:MAG: cation-transporting P-type ATPase [Thermodesulfovibrionales bacterium]